MKMEICLNYIPRKVDVTERPVGEEGKNSYTLSTSNLKTSCLKCSKISDSLRTNLLLKKFQIQECFEF